MPANAGSPEKLDWLEGDIADLRASYARLKPMRDKGPSRWEALAHGRHRVRCLIQEPRESRGSNAAIVYFHGGGWIVGSPKTHADISRWLCEEAGLTVYSVDYRLAPEHTVPAPVEDGLAAIAALPASSIILAGDSAGATIALAVERAADARMRQRLLGVCAFYGCFGGLDRDALKAASREDGLDLASVERMWRLANGSAATSPYAIEALAAMSAVPAYLLAASEDPLMKDTLQLAARYQELERSHVLEIATGARHGFLHDLNASKADRPHKLSPWIASLLL